MNALGTSTVPPGAVRPDEGRPYRGMSPQARRADRRRRLLDAGLELFGTVGYAPTSIEQICAASGVTTRHFYEEYGCREELLKAVHTEIVLEVSRAVTDAIDLAPIDLEARVRCGIDAYVRSMVADVRKAKVFAIEVVGVSSAMEAYRRSILHVFAGMVQHYAEELRADEHAVFPEGLNFTYTTLALVGGTTELMVEWIMSGGAGCLETIIDELVEIYLTLGAPLLGLAPRLTPRVVGRAG